MKKTIFAVKIRGSKTSRDVWIMVKILLAIGLGLGALLALQVAVCKREKPGKPWTACAFPRLGQ